VTRADKTERYADVQQRLESSLADEHNPITVMATVASILKERFPHFHWVGFLLVEQNEMALGPFQGPPACLRLPLNSAGVCGTCYRSRQTVLVPDVTMFQGRVGCDAVSKAEIAVPIVSHDRVQAILDIDCIEASSVDEVDQAELERISGFVAARIAPVGWPTKG